MIIYLLYGGVEMKSLVANNFEIYRLCKIPQNNGGLEVTASWLVGLVHGLETSDQQIQ